MPPEAPLMVLPPIPTLATPPLPGPGNIWPAATHLVVGEDGHTGGKNAFIQGLHGDYIVIF